MTGSGWPGEPGLTESGRPATSGGAGRSSNRSRRVGPGALLVVHAAARLRRLTGAQTLVAAVLVLGAVAMIAWVVIPGGSVGAPGSEGAPAQGASTPPSRGGGDALAQTGLPAQPSDGPGQDATAWRTVLSRLDAARSQAFSRGARDQLAEVDVTDSPAQIEDLKAFDAMRARSAYAQALSPRIEGVMVVSAESTRAVLRVTDTLAPYQFVDAGGRVLKRVARAGTGRARRHLGAQARRMACAGCRRRRRDVTIPISGPGRRSTRRAGQASGRRSRRRADDGG
ncbi:MAG: hypothetical protein ACXV3F_05350 [Frankiaceae bacterium]